MVDVLAMAKVVLKKNELELLNLNMTHILEHRTPVKPFEHSHSNSNRARIQRPFPDSSQSVQKLL